MICTAALGFILDSGSKKKYSQLSSDRPSPIVLYYKKFFGDSIELLDPNSKSIRPGLFNNMSIFFSDQTLGTATTIRHTNLVERDQ